MDRKTKIDCMLSSNVSIKLSNKLIFMTCPILYGGFYNEKITLN